MSKKSYFGVAGVSRNVKSWPFGVDGVARKVKNGYIGVGGVARQFLQGLIPIAVPTVSTNPTYTGISVSPIWSGYDSTKMEISGTTSAVSVGTYTATFTPNEGYAWADGTTSGKNVTWKVIGISPNLKISPTSLALTSANNKSGTFTASFYGSGTITARSNKTGIKVLSVDGKKILIGVLSTQTSAVTATITVTVSASGNYKSESVTATAVYTGK